MAHVSETYGESVAANPDHDVNTDEKIIESAKYDTIYPRKQQRLALKFLTATHTHVCTDTHRQTGRHIHVYTYTHNTIILAMHNLPFGSFISDFT